MRRADAVRPRVPPGHDASRESTRRTRRWSSSIRCPASPAVPGEVNGMVMRLIDFLKSRQITALFTHLIPGEAAAWTSRWRIVADGHVDAVSSPARGTRRTSPVDSEIARHGALGRDAYVRDDGPGGPRRVVARQSTPSGRQSMGRKTTAHRTAKRRSAGRPRRRRGFCGCTSPARRRGRRRRSRISKPSASGIWPAATGSKSSIC